MPSWRTLFKNDNFIAAVELENKKPTLTITKVHSIKLEQEDGKMKDKPIISFKEISRSWVFCKTTGFCLSAMFGEDYTKWIGKRVTLHSELVQVGREQQPGIRITGSPDLEKSLVVKIKLPKKKAFTVNLVKTAVKGDELRDPPPTPSSSEPSPAA